MIKNIFKKSIFLLIILWFVYILVPPPPEIPPLPQSQKSDDPNDMVLVPGITVYYTNLSREEIIKFYQDHYSNSNLFNLPLITYRLNHPPEYFRELTRQTQQATYFEEIVHPMRESLLVSGFQWENDPFTKPEQRRQFRLYIKGNDYSDRITIFQKTSNPIWRVLLSVLIIVVSWWIFKEIKIITREVRQLIRKK